MATIKPKPKAAAVNINTSMTFMKITSEKSGTARFNEDGDPSEQVSGSLYLKSAAYKALGEPQTISVVVKNAD